METLLFIPSIDTRHAQGVIASRIGLETNAYAFENAFNFFDYVEKFIQGTRISCVLLDEAQFLTKHQVFQLTQIVDDLKIPVLAYGLRSDFMGEPFEGSKYLLSWADELTEIKTICHCGRKATMNLRMDGQGKILREGEQIEIGGNDRYIALCRKHFTKGALSSKQIVNELVDKVA